MGCSLSSCCADSESDSDVADERTRLLTDPVSSIVIPSGQSDSIFVQCCDSSPKGTDEQSVLNKILQETATNVIDIAALAPSNIEQNEYLERRSHYNSKLMPISSWQTGIKLQCYLTDISIPEKVFTPNPISVENALLIKRAASKIKTALKELNVYHTEDLIVPFAIP